MKKLAMDSTMNIFNILGYVSHPTKTITY